MVDGCMYSQKRKVRCKGAAADADAEGGSAGVCESCGDGATKVEVQDTYRFLFVPLFRRSRSQIMCNTCEWRRDV